MGNLTFPDLLCFVSGVILRLILYRTSLPEWLCGRTEVVSPLTSWERAMEGISLHKQGISPYSGDLFHEMPLMLQFLSVISTFSSNAIMLFFLLLEIVQGYILLKICNSFARYLLFRQAMEVKNFNPNAEKLMLTKLDLLNMQFYVMIGFAFNPYSLSAFLTKSTVIFNNLAILLALYYMLQDNRLFCGVFIAVASYISMYPIVLCVPAGLYFAQIYKRKPEESEQKFLISNLIEMAIITAVPLGLLLLFSILTTDSWEFFSSTYGFILSVPDLTPNLGIFWYFFTEMFEHFRTFFICVFQINVVIYTVPLSVRLKEHPVFLFYLLVFLIGIFKSYPSYGDTGLILTLLPLWKHVFTYMRNNFVVSCMLICTTVFAPILYHLWIYAGSANANFYFAIALAFSTAQIFLVTDLLYGFLRREFDLYNGVKHMLPDGKETQVILE
ncbi:hypothetical protein FSP39_023280 [Pinctada imbricata]|uniref:Phosphatidylinositol glycan anchor biosynthesis class U protein n=1 Tax=Pinctada imbricata TaxID=66713 RepID=A0AA88XK16_PINIB|nr:hypothetical protein FSP39_023280 [Pinctada imbricata]